MNAPVPNPVAGASPPKKKKAPILILSLAAIGTFWLTMVAAVMFWQFWPHKTLLGFNTRASTFVDGHRRGSIGDERQRMLHDATRLYREQSPDAAASIAEGEGFAPVPFLNRELKRQGAKWRVRSINGLDAEIYEVS